MKTINITISQLLCFGFTIAIFILVYEFNKLARVLTKKLENIESNKRPTSDILSNTTNDDGEPKDDTLSMSQNPTIDITLTEYQLSGKFYYVANVTFDGDVFTLNNQQKHYNVILPQNKLGAFFKGHYNKFNEKNVKIHYNVYNHYLDKNELVSTIQKELKLSELEMKQLCTTKLLEEYFNYKMTKDKYVMTIETDFMLYDRNGIANIYYFELF